MGKQCWHPAAVPTDRPAAGCVAAGRCTRALDSVMKRRIFLFLLFAALLACVGADGDRHSSRRDAQAGLGPLISTASLRYVLRLPPATRVVAVPAIR
jgi:hypothetical protein